MRAHGSIHGYRPQSVPFELLHGEQEQRDEDAPFEANREERHQHRRDLAKKGPGHGDNLRDSDPEPNWERVTTAVDVIDGPARAARDRAQQKPGLETLGKGILVDLQELDALVSCGRRHRLQGYTAGR
jgi:hypothetical protein